MKKLSQLKKLLLLTILFNTNQMFTAAGDDLSVQSQMPQFDTSDLPQAILLADIMRFLEQREANFFAKKAESLRYPERIKEEERKKIEEKIQDRITFRVSKWKSGDQVHIGNFDNLCKRTPEYEKYRNLNSIKPGYGTTMNINFYKDTPGNERDIIEKILIPEDIRMDHQESFDKIAPGDFKIDKSILHHKQLLKQYSAFADSHPRKAKLIKECEDKIRELEQQKRDLDLPLTDDQIRETSEYKAHRRMSQSILDKYKELYKSIEQIVEDSVLI